MAAVFGAAGGQTNGLWGGNCLKLPVALTTAAIVSLSESVTKNGEEHVVAQGKAVFF